jgi:hypothetical protein
MKPDDIRRFSARWPNSLGSQAEQVAGQIVHIGLDFPPEIVYNYAVYLGLPRPVQWTVLFAANSFRGGEMGAEFSCIARSEYGNRCSSPLTPKTQLAGWQMRYSRRKVAL